MDLLESEEDGACVDGEALELEEDSDAEEDAGAELVDSDAVEPFLLSVR